MQSTITNNYKKTKKHYNKLQANQTTNHSEHFKQLPNDDRNMSKTTSKQQKTTNNFKNKSRTVIHHPQKLQKKIKTLNTNKL